MTLAIIGSLLAAWVVVVLAWWVWIKPIDDDGVAYRQAIAEAYVAQWEDQPCSK